MFFPFNIAISKWSGSWNNINYQYANICVPNVVNMSRTNKKRHIEWHETCKCECKFGANVCNNRQR